MVIDQLSPAYFERLISIDTVSHVFLIRYGNSMGSCFIIDVDKKVLRPFDEEEFAVEKADFVRFKEVSRDWEEHYNGT